MSQLTGIYDHIAEDNPTAAASQSRRIVDAAQRLIALPHLGHPGRIQGSRELVVAGTPYLIAYRIHTKTIQILAVKHGAQLWPSSFTG